MPKSRWYYENTVESLVPSPVPSLAHLAGYVATQAYVHPSVHVLCVVLVQQGVSSSSVLKIGKTPKRKFFRDVTRKTLREAHSMLVSGAGHLPLWSRYSHQ